jgi:hypothetical protein
MQHNSDMAVHSLIQNFAIPGAIGLIVIGLAAIAWQFFLHAIKKSSRKGGAIKSQHFLEAGAANLQNYGAGRISPNQPTPVAGNNP